ncbi:MAG: alanine racemase C-terminal domain-containing protein [Oscillospiraceae bacterium]
MSSASCRKRASTSESATAAIPPGFCVFPITRWTPCASARQSSADSLLRAAIISSASARSRQPSTSCAGFPGHTCGYGAGWRAKKPTRIAVLPVGWYNGFGCQMGNDLTRRKDSLRGIFSNLRHLIFGRKGYTVLLGGKRCRVLGHIGMLHTVVDVTNVNCKLGDKAVFDVNPLMLKGVDVVFQ